MIKRGGIIVVFMLCHARGLYAQLYDRVWLSGQSVFSNMDTYVVNHSDNIIFDIRNDTPVISRDSLGANFLLNNISMSNSTGDSLLFYSNGITIRNRYNQVMQNGDSLAWTYWLNTQGLNENGLFTIHSQICVPTDSPHIFYHFYTDMDTLGITISPKHLMVARVDVLNDKLTFKDSIVISDTLNTNVGAVKDAQRGWWIVTTERENGCINIIHLDSNAHIVCKRICDDSFIKFPSGSLVNTVFTQDGTKLVLVGGDYNYQGIEVFDFDRCTGTLVLEKKSDIPVIADSSWAAWSAAGSPNSRFIYAFWWSRAVQFDLWADDVGGSMKVVAHATGTPLDHPTNLYQGMLAADGKIYINSANGQYAYSVIESPDEEGLACNVVQDLLVPDLLYFVAFPYYPNYRLEPADCHETGVKQEIRAVARAYPNPTNCKLWIEYEGIVWEASRNVTVYIHDALGREMYGKKLPMYSAVHSVDIQEWSDGIYFFSLVADNKEIGAGKFVKE